MMTDIAGSIAPLRHALTHPERWAKPEKRRVQFPLVLLGETAAVESQPRGVVGVIVLWMR